MSRRVVRGVGSFWPMALVVGALSGLTTKAHAQTTVVLDAPAIEAFDTTVRAGSYANRNFDGDELITRASDTTDYVRRALMKFDTETRVPANASISSARLTLTVKEGNQATRTLSAYRIAHPFDAGKATWKKRRQDLAWRTAGGDLGKKYAEATATAAAGSKVTFNVTKLVQQAVNGDFDTRWTRIAVIDEGLPERASYKVYYSSEASDASVRPTLTVVYGGNAGPDPADDETLPSGWTSSGIGGAKKKGAANFEGGVFNVRAAGADIWNSSDQLHFVYRTLEGNGAIEAKVKSLDDVHEWTKAGVMVREKLSSDSRHAFMLVSPGMGVAFQRRRSTGNESVYTDGGNGKAPYFVKLTRAGSTFSAYRSKDGSSWSLVGRSTISMASTVYVGLAVTSHDPDIVADAAFTDVSVHEGTPPDDGEDDDDDNDDDDGDDDDDNAKPPPSSGKTLRLLHWNAHHGGRRADDVDDPAGFAGWLAKFKPDVITLNEIDSVAQADRILDELKERMPGVPWTYFYLGNMKGNMILSRLPIDNQSRCELNSADDRQVAHIGIVVNGRRINIWNAHLTLDGSKARTQETRALQACERDWPEARIAAGDYNMQADSPEYKSMAEDHDDAWREAKSLGTAVNYSDNCDGCTRNSRIDYVFTSKGASWLVLKSAQIFDTRNSNGVMASDHKPMLVVYEVK